MADIDPDQAALLAQMQADQNGGVTGVDGIQPPFQMAIAGRPMSFSIPQSQAPAPAPDSNTYAPTNMGGYDAAVTKNESGGDPNAHTKIPGQTSSGLYGFIDGTYQQTIAKHPELAGADKNDPRVLHAATIDNAKEISPQLGRQPSQVDLIAAHVLGPAGAVHFLRSDPNSSVVGAVSPDALANNKQVFFNPDGSPKTVGQVYAEAAAKVKGNPTMPPVEGGFATPYSNNNPAPALTASGSAPGGVSPNDPMAKAQAMFKPQQDAIDAYKAGQPAMWAKLQEMQDAYKKASTPTMMDRLQDAISGFQQQQAIAQGNMHANAGAAILGRDQPSGQSFANALQSSHQIDVDARKQRLEQAKTGYEMGSTTLMAQNAQQLSNLGLSSDLLKSAITAGQKGQELGINQQQADTQATHVANEFTFQMAQLGQTQQVEVGNYAKSLITNDATRAKVLLDFSQQRVQGASYAQNVALINNLTAQAMKNGMAVSDKAPTLVDVTTPTTNADGTPGLKHEIVNTEPSQDGGAGMARMKELSQVKGYVATPVTSAQAVNVTNTVSNGPGGGEGGGSAQPLTPDKEYGAAQQMKANVEGAKKLLAYITQNGGTSAMSADPNGLALRGILQQYNITSDPTLSARQVFAKIMASIANQATQTDLRNGGGNTSGRGGYAMFAQIGKGNVTDQASPAAIDQFLTHTGNMADYMMNKNSYLIKTEREHEVNRVPFHNNAWESHNWETQTNPDGSQAHPYPQWHPDEVTTPAQPGTAPSLPSGVPQGSLWSASRGQWKGPDGTVYDSTGKSVSAAGGQ